MSDTMKTLAEAWAATEWTVVAGLIATDPDCPMPFDARVSMPPSMRFDAVGDDG